MTIKYFRSHQAGNQYNDLITGSDLVYKISRPPEHPDKATDHTLYEYNVFEHPTNSGDWVAAIGDRPIEIDPIVVAQGQGVPAIPGWQAFFGGAEASTKKAIITGNVTGTINAQDFTRSQWTEHTYNDLLNDGWFG